MEHYTLKENEVVLYKGDTTCKELPSAKIQLILTNLFFILIIKTKKLFSKEEISVEKYPIENIKFYNDKPQINQDGTKVEIYMNSGEQTLIFSSKNEAHKFVNKSLDLLTGKSLFQRTADKAKKAVSVVDDTFGIDTVDAVKTVLNKEPEKAKDKKGIIAKNIFSLAKSVITSKERNNMTDNEKWETLKKLKALFQRHLWSLLVNFLN